MPEISRFYGIVIYMYFNDHPPPHFHAEYGEYEALIAINTLTVIHGNLPRRQLKRVKKWASQHQGELHDIWQIAQSMLPLYRIPPLP
ncbi:MAG: transcriptional regulator [Anaerolineaceae bacterium 4572_78]|nr:MAG: transcriptional regulator [Anaerolineaceae bacterium 4572_78]